jgi:large subunit ribosomal protein L30
MAKRSSKKGDTLKIQLVRSPIGYPEKQKKTVQALGFRRVHQTLEVVDSPVLRGMINKVSHLVVVKE